MHSHHKISSFPFFTQTNVLNVYFSKVIRKTRALCLEHVPQKYGDTLHFSC